MTGEPLNGPVPRLGRTPSRWRIHGTPIVCVIIGSLVPALLPLISQSPTLPPFGLLLLVSWRLTHREIWPVWIGAPLGAFDDLMSGNPLGTAVLIWSLTMIALEFADDRLFWRSYWHDWLIAILACFFFLAGGFMIARISGSAAPFTLLIPQMLWSALLYPIIVRVTAGVDRWRMMA